MRHAQSGLELMVFVSFSLLIFAGFYFSVLKKDINVANRQEALQAGDISEGIAFEIRTAKSAGDGYTRNFTIKNNIYGTPYSVRLEKNMVLLDVGDRTYASNGFITNVSGSVSPGCNTIRNIQGNMSISPC